MLFTIVTLICVAIYFASMFTGGKSFRDVREIFFGNYYAEDGLINSTDKPNSLQAFESCIENGIGIKTELQLTKDRRVAVSTYNDLSREYGIDKKISETDMEELESFGIVSLTQLVEMTKDKVPLVLELKVCDNNEALCRSTADIINSSERKDIAVCSFHAAMVGWFRDKEKHIFRGIISLPPKEFKNLGKFERWITGNLGNNANCRPNFMLYRNRPLSIFIKFALMSGVFNGVWTLDNADEAKQLEAEKEMIVIRGFMPETVHFKDLPAVEKTPQQIESERKYAEKIAKKQAKLEEKHQQELAHERRISEILADDDDFDDEPDFFDEIEEEATEVVAEIKEEISEVIEEVKEELTEAREKLIGKE